MFLQKQKNIIQNIGARLGDKLTLAPLLLSVGIFGLILYLQPMPTHTQNSSQEITPKKNITHHVVAPPKVTQPAVSTPKVATVVPGKPLPTPVKASIQAGTPKPEPVVTPSPSSNVSGLTPTTPVAPPSSSQAPSSQTTTGYTSTNWSGYLAATGSFIGISGSWAATLATGNGSTTSADSTWIGIGGVTTNDLIQVGTQNIISAGGQVSTEAFYELLPNVSQAVPGVTVSPGDTMTASITEVSSGQWTIIITDTTDGESDTLNVAYASSLSSAEWIEEDPSFSFRRQIPFDNFHSASFTNASTTTTGGTFNLATSTAQPVTMVNNSGQTIAVPSAIGSDGASFTVSP
jgi:hypothetical protein